MSTSQDKDSNVNTNITSPSQNKKTTMLIEISIKKSKKFDRQRHYSDHHNGNNYVKSRNKNHERKNKQSDNCWQEQNRINKF